MAGSKYEYVKRFELDDSLLPGANPACWPDLHDCCIRMRLGSCLLAGCCIVVRLDGKGFTK
jgi:hypothetical protein